MALFWLRSLMPLRWPALAGFGLSFFLGVVISSSNHPGSRAAQPIVFNHAKHMENGMSCTDCHAGAQSPRSIAGRLTVGLWGKEPTVRKSVTVANLRLFHS